MGLIWAIRLAEYTSEAVAGRSVFLTTTNGTRALHHARLAQRVVVGALREPVGGRGISSIRSHGSIFFVLGPAVK